MTTDKRIEAFEAAFVRKYGFGRMTASSNDEAMAMYAAAYWAWNEALKSVVVELPPEWKPVSEKDEGANEMRNACIDAIESAGVRVKE